VKAAEEASISTNSEHVHVPKSAGVVVVIAAFRWERKRTLDVEPDSGREKFCCVPLPLELQAKKQDTDLPTSKTE
jgi:hypothetical protein